MAEAGLKPVSVSSNGTSGLRNPPVQSAAESGAVGASQTIRDDDLQAIINAWPTLSEPAKAQILKIAKPRISGE